MENNNEIFKTIKEDVMYELIEKKSRFIANVFVVESSQEAMEKIKNIKKKYYDAKHNCFAFRVLENGSEIVKTSDDGEPSGTAGEPILNVIKKNNLENILIVVTRYFGGILLGTGGLIRAYSNASVEALNKAIIIKQEEGVELELILEYSDSEKFKYYCEQNNIKINKIKYEENVVYIVETNIKIANELKMSNISKNINKTINIKSYVEKCRKYVENKE